MKRFSIALLMTLFVASAAAAQTTTPPPPPTTPPAGQKPTPPPATPQTAKPPAPAPVPFPADVKIGFVNMQYIVSESKYGKGGTDKLAQLRTKRLADNQAVVKQRDTLENEIRTQSAVMAPAVMQQKQQELDRIVRKLQFEEQQLQVDMEALEGQLMEDFAQKVLPIVEQLRKDKNLWAIFTSGSGSNVAALMPGVDLSLDVIKILDGGK